MLNVTVLETEDLRTINREVRYRYLLAAVGAGTTSDENQLPIGHVEGKLVEVHVACQSADYILSIRSAEGVSESGSIDEIYLAEVNSTFDDPEINNFFSNGDVPQTTNLYAVIENNGIDTGDIYLDLVFIPITLSGGVYPWD